DDDHALHHAHLVRRQTDPVVGLHGLAHVGDQRPQRLVGRGDIAGLLAKHRVAVDPHRADAHPLASLMTWTIALLANSTLMSSPILSTALASSMPTTVPKMPPEVSTRSPFLTAASIFSVCFFCCCCG